MFIVGSKENFIEATNSTGSKGVMGFYQIPAGAKVKVEVKFRDGHYRDMRQEIEVYNSNQKVVWIVQIEPSHEQYLAGTFTFTTINEYKTFSPETLEFISKGWIYIHGWNMPYKGSWLNDSAEGVDIDYLKVSYAIQ